MRYRSPRHRAAPPNPDNPLPAPDGVPSTVPIIDEPVIRIVFTAATPFIAPLPIDDPAALDQRAA